MSFFDSPIARCEAIHELVLTDETQRECACEHDCPSGRVCPLDGYFADDEAMPTAGPQHRQPRGRRRDQRLQ